MKNQVLNDWAPETRSLLRALSGMFQAAVNTARALFEAGKLESLWTYQCEYLAKPGTMHQDWTPMFQGYNPGMLL